MAAFTRALIVAALLSSGWHLGGEPVALDAAPLESDGTHVGLGYASVAESGTVATELELPTSAERGPSDMYWTTDPFTGAGQWGWRVAQVDAAWAERRGSADLIVATIDTGVDRGHPDLAAALLPGTTMLSAPSAVCPEGDGEDDNSHGTHIAGIIGATSDNGIGISGVAPGVRILPVKALDCVGLGMTSDIAAGIVWATDHGARIVNVSLGTSADSAALAAAVKYALDRDVLIVAAAGNCGTGGGRCSSRHQLEYPAAYPGVLAVGATDPSDALAPFSTNGPQLALAAPGVRIVSTLPHYGTYESLRGGSVGYGVLTGTSQASAFVAGVAALIWSAAPDLSAHEIARELMATAEDRGALGRDDGYGYGRVNALRALRAAQAAAARAARTRDDILTR